MVGLEPNLEIVGTASDYDELIAGATEIAPEVLVTVAGEYERPPEEGPS